MIHIVQQGRGSVEWKGRLYGPGDEIPDLDRKTADRLVSRGIVAEKETEAEAKARAAKEAKRKAEAEAKAKAEEEAKAKEEAEAKAKAEEEAKAKEEAEIKTKDKGAK